MGKELRFEFIGGTSREKMEVRVAAAEDKPDSPPCFFFPPCLLGDPRVSAGLTKMTE